METHELDLHDHTRPEAIQAFITLYNDAFDRAIDPAAIQLKLVHGYGSTGEGGVLRKRLRSFLEGLRDRLDFTPGEDIDGNQGCTVVSVIKRLPEWNDLLEEQIWEYVEGAPTSRSQEKIVGRFRSHGQPQVMQAIKSLQKKGQMLRKSSAKGQIMYEVCTDKPNVREE